MSKKSCQYCLFNDQCPSTRPCQHYSPVVEDEGDADDLIELGREQFYREWESYIADVQPSDY